MGAPAKNEQKTEFVIGLVGPLGVDFGALHSKMEDLLKSAEYSYSANPVRLSEFLRIPAFAKIHGVKLELNPEAARLRSHMDAGDKLRQETRRYDILAVAAAAQVFSQREALPFRHGTAHILRSLKRPEEAWTLRQIYREGFWLIGAHADREARMAGLTNRGVLGADAEELMSRDEQSTEKGGQATTDTFELADVFVRCDGPSWDGELDRFLRLVFGDQYVSPTPDEHAMFLAYAASFRSLALSRQVGAAVANLHGDVVSLGTNDVPRAGGGLYWPGAQDQRDARLGHDSSDLARKELVDDIGSAVRDLAGEAAWSDQLAKRIRRGRLREVTEFGRTVHAEMEALLGCARSGVSPREGTLYTTTFPCHNCARHIVAAGIARVVYVEPYAKSWAKKLHSDSITFSRKEWESERTTEKRKVLFEPFVGVAARRYADLFSMRLGLGYQFVGDHARKDRQGNVRGPNCEVRVKMPPTSYIDREKEVARDLNGLLSLTVKEDA